MKTDEKLGNRDRRNSFPKPEMGIETGEH